MLLSLNHSSENRRILLMRKQEEDAGCDLQVLDIKKKSLLKESLVSSGLVTYEYPAYQFRKLTKDRTILVYYKRINSSFIH